MAAQAPPQAVLNDPPRRTNFDEGPALVLVNSKCRLGRESLPATLSALEARGIPVAGSHRVSKPKSMA
jgi:diacylglycerol kinase (ATP)